MQLDYKKLTQIRASAVLTTGYVAATVISDLYKYNQLILYVSLTKATMTSFELKAEFSHDGTNYYQSVMLDPLEGTATVREMTYQIVAADQASATQLYRIAIPITDRYGKISVKATGVVTSSACAIDAALGKTGN